MQFLMSDGRKSLSCHSSKLSLQFPSCISQHKYVWSWMPEVIKAFKKVFKGTEGMVQKWEILKLALMSRKATLDHVLLLQQKDEWIQKLTYHSFTSAAWGINRKCTRTGSRLLGLRCHHTQLSWVGHISSFHTACTVEPLQCGGCHLHQHEVCLLT